MTPSLQVGYCFEMEEALRKSELDIAIVPMHKKTSGFSYIPLYLEEMQLFCGRGHPLFSGPDENLTVERILVYPFAVTPFLATTEMQLPLLHMKIGANACNMEAMAILLLTGHYLGYLPVHMARRFVREGRLRALGPAQFTMQLQFAALTRSEQQPTAILKAFLKELQNCSVSERRAA